MKNHAIQARKNVFKVLNPGALLMLDAGKALHRSLDAYHDFSVDHNFYYLTGIDAPNARLVLLKTESSEKTMLFLEPDTPLSLKWDGPKFSQEDAQAAGGFDVGEIYSLSQFDALFNQLMNFARSPYGEPPVELWLDLYHESKDSTPRPLETFAPILKNFPEFRIQNANSILARLRMIKSDDEIAAIKKAIFYTHQGLKRIIKSLPKRAYEYELVADFMHETALLGSTGSAFDTIAAAGENATVLHYVNNDAAIQGDLILFDLGAKHGRYNADISRTYPIGGTYQGYAKDVYEAVLDVQKKLVEMVQPGLTWKALNEAAKTLLAEKAVALKMIDSPEVIGDVYYHSVGHFLGLDVHDVGLYTEPFQPGMVLTIEPGLYGQGIGVRIEDNILVTETGNENLSAAIEKETSAIEKLF